MRQGRLDCQAIANRHVPATLFITVTMSCNAEEFGRPNLDIQHLSSYAPESNKFRPYDRPDVAARVLNQRLNEIQHRLLTRGPEYFNGYESIGLASRVEYQERDMPHAHIVLWLNCGDLTDPAEIDAIISAEMHRHESEATQQLVRRIMSHRHSPSCRRGRDEGTCRFGYDSNEVVPQNYINSTTHRAVHRKRETQDLRIVPHNLRLLKEFKMHINVERGGSAETIGYIWKYVFKVPRPAVIRLEERQDQHHPGV